MRLIFAAMLACVLLFGCCATTEQQQTTPLPQDGGAEGEVQGEAQPGEEQPEPEAPPAEEAQEEETSVAHSQEDCATLSNNCESCTAKSGCGWCKGSNSCLFGTDEGPSTGQCPAEEWTTTLDECSVLQGGSECSEITNCVSCMSGTGCKWCIQGSVCAPESTQDECFGGWLSETYQCNYASR